MCGWTRAGTSGHLALAVAACWRMNLATLYRKSPNLDHLRGTYLGLVHAAAEWEQHYGYNRTDEQTFHRFMVDGHQPIAKHALELAASLAE